MITPILPEIDGLKQPSVVYVRRAYWIIFRHLVTSESRITGFYSFSCQKIKTLILGLGKKIIINNNKNCSIIIIRKINPAKTHSHVFVSTQNFNSPSHFNYPGPPFI